MKTVLYIHSFPGATATLAMLWGGFKLLGWPIIGVECIDGKHEWPEPVPTIAAGINAYWNQDSYNLPSRLVQTLEHFLAGQYDRCCIVEYDTLITGPLPDYPPGCVMQHAGGQLPDSAADRFYHTPWIFDRDSAEVVVREGMRLMHDGTVGMGCHGSPDVFLGLIVQRTGLPVQDSGTFSRNTIDRAEDKAAARAAFLNGCTFFHGVKMPEHRDAILCA